MDKACNLENRDTLYYVIGNILTTHEVAIWIDGKQEMKHSVILSALETCFNGRWMS